MARLNVNISAETDTAIRDLAVDGVTATEVVRRAIRAWKYLNDLADDPDVTIVVVNSRTKAQIQLVLF